MDDDVQQAIAEILRIIGGGEAETLDAAIHLALLRGYDVEIVLSDAPAHREACISVTEDRS